MFNLFKHETPKAEQPIAKPEIIEDELLKKILDSRYENFKSKYPDKVESFTSAINRYRKEGKTENEINILISGPINKILENENVLDLDSPVYDFKSLASEINWNNDDIMEICRQIASKLTFDIDGQKKLATSVFDNKKIQIGNMKSIGLSEEKKEEIKIGILESSYKLFEAIKKADAQKKQYGNYEKN